MALNPQDGWEYRKEIQISDPDNVSDGYQLKLTVYAGEGTDNAADGIIYCDNHCRSFPDDIRFGTTDDPASATQLGQFIEYYTATVAYIWVRCPSNDTFYMFVGNSYADIYSDGSDTFDYFIDMYYDDPTNNSEWSFSGYYAYENNYLRLGDGNDNHSGIAELDLTSSVVYGTTKTEFRSLFKHNALGVAGQAEGRTDGNYHYKDDNNYSGHNWSNYADPPHKLVKKTSASGIETVTSENVDLEYSDKDRWWLLRVKGDYIENEKWDYDQTNKKILSGTPTDTTALDYCKFRINTWQGKWAIKIVCLLKYTTGTEPSWSSFGPWVFIGTVTRSYHLESLLLGEYKWRKEIDITNFVSEYQIKLTVYAGEGNDDPANKIIYCDNHCENFPYDIRFGTSTKFTYDTQLPQWFESYDSTQATIWIKLPSSTTDKIYMFVGCKNEILYSDGDETFLLFDHFDDTEVDANKWEVKEGGPGGKGNCYYIIENSQFKLYGDDGAHSSSNWVAYCIRSSSTFGFNHKIIARVTGCTVRNGKTVNIAFAGSNIDSFDRICSSNACGYREGTGSGTDNSSDNPNAYNTNSDGTAMVDIPDWTEPGQITVIKRSDKTIVIAPPGTYEVTSYIPSEAGYVYIYTGSGWANSGFTPHIYVDWIAVCKYADPEPSISSTGPWVQTGVAVYTKSLSATSLLEAKLLKAVLFDSITQATYISSADIDVSLMLHRFQSLLSTVQLKKAQILNFSLSSLIEITRLLSSNLDSFLASRRHLSQIFDVDLRKAQRLLQDITSLLQSTSQLSSDLSALIKLLGVKSTEVGSILSGLQKLMARTDSLLKKLQRAKADINAFISKRSELSSLIDSLLQITKELIVPLSADLLKVQSLTTDISTMLSSANLRHLILQSHLLKTQAKSTTQTSLLERQLLQKVSKLNSILYLIQTKSTELSAFFAAVYSRSHTADTLLWLTKELQSVLSANLTKGFFRSTTLDTSLIYRQQLSYYTNTLLAFILTKKLTSSSLLQATYERKLYHDLLVIRGALIKQSAVIKQLAENLTIFIPTIRRELYVWCSRWDEDNWRATVEIVSDKWQRDLLIQNTTPGAVAELYNILGEPKYWDTTFTSGNTLFLYPNKTRPIAQLRDPVKVAVKSYKERMLTPNKFYIKLDLVKL